MAEWSTSSITAMYTCVSSTPVTLCLLDPRRVPRGSVLSALLPPLTLGRTRKTYVAAPWGRDPTAACDCRCAWPDERG
jgi:hypothetical protein